VSGKPGLFGRKPSWFTIPPEVPFVDALARGILDEVGEGPELVRTRILLPTRRACRSLADAFLRLGDGRPMLLPRLTPLGDIDEDDLAFEGWEVSALGEDSAGGADIPPAIAPLRRELMLTRLILADKKAPGVDQAVALAHELARLLDQVHTERLGLDGLERLVPDDYAQHWQVTLSFLRILTDVWPGIVAEEGVLDPAERRNRLLAAQAEAWSRRPPEGAVIAAGSTGSIPATADLLQVIADLPQGAVVLPGLDRDMDDTAWKVLGSSHPQYGMARLLDRLGVARKDVAAWPEAEGARGIRSRVLLVNRALRPAEATETWREEAAPPKDALNGVEVVACPGPQEEAGVIALAMRQVLEDESSTAALVTPDRGLARRVAAELARWGVDVDDSAGRPLAQTPPGAFLRLTARMAAEVLAPIPFLACLKHPLAAAGLSTVACRTQVRRIELDALRGPRPQPGADGLRAALKGKRDLMGFVDRVETALAPFTRLLKRSAVPLTDLLKAHVEAAEALAATDADTGASRLWAGDAGEAAAAFIAELNEAGETLAAIEPESYAALLDGLMGGHVVRPRYGAHPRLSIWGLMEARLQRADVMILGGLNEGTWPPEVPASPWMSRPMMERFGLPLPERRIGQTAHDFVQAFAAPRVLVTRASRVEGTPTVPSRWLLRLETMVRGTPLAEVFKGNDQWLRWQEQLDKPARRIEVRPPAPRPPVAARPRKLSVTRIETWMRDPYGIYARYILRLQALDPIDADPGAADYGSFIHDALDKFLVAYPKVLPDDALERLLEIGKDCFGASLARPGIEAFWWPRFERIARWFVDEEAGRRAEVVTSLSEARGKLIIQGPAGPFEINGIADRIDRLKDGGLVIVDYKTGAIPAHREIAAGYAPQLPLEGAIAAAGGFDKLGKQMPTELEFWQLTGGNPAGERCPVKGDTPTLVREALEGLQRLIAEFDNPDTPYQARPRPDAAPRYDDYEHLARVKEWSAGEGES
jgi:ATP-dependent helicase/nuclease subunit B